MNRKPMEGILSWARHFLFIIKPQPNRKCDWAPALAGLCPNMWVLDCGSLVACFADSDDTFNVHQTCGHTHTNGAQYIIWTILHQFQSDWSRSWWLESDECCLGDSIFITCPVPKQQPNIYLYQYLYNSISRYMSISKRQHQHWSIYVSLG